MTFLYGALWNSKVEIAISDPVDGTSGWAYLFAFADKAPRSSADYVTYDPAAEKVTAREYCNLHGQWKIEN